MASSAEDIWTPAPINFQGGGSAAKLGPVSYKSRPLLDLGRQAPLPTAAMLAKKPKTGDKDGRIGQTLPDEPFLMQLVGHSQIGQPIKRAVDIALVE